MSFKNREEIISYFDEELEKKGVDSLRNIFLFVATRGGKTKISNSIASTIASYYGDTVKILITKSHLKDKAKSLDYKDFKVISYTNLPSKNFGIRLKKGEKERSYNDFFYQLTEKKPYILVLDECHELKSLSTAHRELVVPLLALSKCNIFLTGTPMGNNSLEYLQLLILGVEVGLDKNKNNIYKGKFTSLINFISPFNQFGHEIATLKNDTEEIFKDKDRGKKREEYALAKALMKLENLEKNIFTFDKSHILKSGIRKESWCKNDETDFFKNRAYSGLTSKGLQLIKSLEENTLIIRMTEDNADHYDYSNYENILHQVDSNDFDFFESVSYKIKNDEEFRINITKLFSKVIKNEKAGNIFDYLKTISGNKILEDRFIFELGQVTRLERINASSLKHNKIKEIIELHKGENIIIWTSYHEERIELIKKFGFLDGSKQENRLKYEVEGGIIVMSMLSNAEGLNWHHGRIAIFLSPNHSSTAFTQARARTMGFEQKEKVINHIIFTKEERKLKDKMLEKYEFNKNMKV